MERKGENLMMCILNVTDILANYMQYLITTRERKFAILIPELR